MPAFYFAMLTSAITCICGREGVRVARLSAALASPAPLLAAVAIGLGLAVTIGGWAGDLIAPTLPSRGKLFLLAIALLVTGLEVALLRAPAQPMEPTRSAGAIVLVVLVAQLTGAAGFLAFALSVAFGPPLLASVGAFLGAILPLTVSAVAADDWTRTIPISLLRWLGSGALLGGGAMMAWSALV